MKLTLPLLLLLSKKSNLISSQKYKSSIEERNDRCKNILPNTICSKEENKYYSTTSYPNSYGHQTQNEAMVELTAIFRGFKNVDCHPYAKLFFCTCGEGLGN